MKKLSFIVLLIFFGATLLFAQTSFDFDRFFINKTMRIDYYHIGDAKQEFVTLDKVYQQGIWAGSTKNLIDCFNNGRYYVKIYDYSTNQMIFSKGFDSYFGEYKTTNAALKGIKRTYHETVLIPYPKNKIQFTLEVRDQDNMLHQLFSQIIDPKGVDIIRESPVQEVKVFEFLKSGHPHRKVDIAFIAEGYTASEERKFRSDVLRLLKVFFNHKPYKSRKDKFNIYGVFKPSDESGCDEPTYGSFKNTVLNSTFNSLGSQRYLLTEDNKSLRDITACVPYDALYILVNTKRYGGGGIYNLYCTVIADNQWTNYVFLHEFGHSFAGLADEYYTSTVAYNEFYPRGVEPVEPNITALLDPENLKWKNLCTSGIEIPTPWEKEAFDQMDMEYQKIRQKINKKIAKMKREGAPESEVKKIEEESERLSREHAQKVDDFLKKSKYAGQVGTFEGAGYSAKGLYRPMVDCIMFTKGVKPFCTVCQQAIIRVINHYTQ
ncbi:MAG: M64 family metallopeptidase [Candidatus Aminicenantia bacterium]